MSLVHIYSIYNGVLKFSGRKESYSNGFLMGPQVTLSEIRCDRNGLAVFTPVLKIGEIFLALGGG